MKLRIIYLFNFLFMILILSFVQVNNNKNTPFPITSWSKHDLKLLDPVDSNSAHSCDILAIFLRKLPNTFEIRVSGSADSLNCYDSGSCSKLLTVKNLGDLNWKNFQRGFRG